MSLQVRLSLDWALSVGIPCLGISLLQGRGQQARLPLVYLHCTEVSAAFERTDNELEWSLTVGHLEAVEEMSSLEDGYVDRFTSPTDAVVDVERLLTSLSGQYAPTFRGTAITDTNDRHLASTLDLLSRLPAESAEVSCFCFLVVP
jgi:hypothetical protein